MKINFTRVFVVLCFISASGLLRAADLPLIKPGEVWLDDRGQHVQAHGGGILKFGDVFCWFGEDRSQTNTRITKCVACYSSTNLAQWTFRNQVVRLTDPENLGRGWVDRKSTRLNSSH